jgi:hypothetical protein
MRHRPLVGGTEDLALAEEELREAAPRPPTVQDEVGALAGEVADGLVLRVRM